jgi:hypothetical protein
MLPDTNGDLIGQKNVHNRCTLVPMLVQVVLVAVLALRCLPLGLNQQRLNDESLASTKFNERCILSICDPSAPSWFDQQRPQLVC